MSEKLYSIAELSPILSLHEKTILRFIHEGRIEARKIGRSWMVTEEELKRYVHGELAGPQHAEKVPDQSLADRISVSAVIEITEHSDSEASRISNSLMAMLSGAPNGREAVRFDSFYYPEIEKAKYVIHGSPADVRRILESFEHLCQQR